MKKTNQLKSLQAAYKMAQLERELSAQYETQNVDSTCLYCWTPVSHTTCQSCGNEVSDLSNDPFLSMNDYVQEERQLQVV